MDIKLRVYQILDINNNKDKVSKGFNIFLFVLILLNIAAVVFETVDSMYITFNKVFIYFELFSVIFFLTEYIFRIWTSDLIEGYSNQLTDKVRFMLTPFMIIDLLAILPFFVFFLYLDLRFLRVLRIVRMLRIFKLGKFIKSMNKIAHVFKSKKYELSFTFVVVAVLLLISSSLIYFVENKHQPEAFSSIPNSMWWGVITLTTVGYGDVYPISNAGKVIGAFISLLGIGMVALPTGIISSGFMEVIEENKKTERESSKCCPNCGAELKE